MEKIDYAVLCELQTVLEQKEKLIERENKLSYPLLNDLELVPLIYEWYKELQQINHWRSKVGVRRFRKQFIFIILYLYAPAALAGAYTPAGLRDKICKLWNLKSLTSISNSCNDMLFCYRNYKDFRRELNFLYHEILERLRKEKLI